MGTQMQKWTPASMEQINDGKEIEEYGPQKEFIDMKKNGKYVVRVLPGVGGHKWFSRAQQHYINVEGVSRAAIFNCPRAHGKGRCKACEQVDKWSRTGNPADGDKAYDWQAKLRVYCNVIDRNNPERGPQVWAFSKGMWGDLQNLLDDKDAGGDFTNPEKDGFDLVVTRGTGKNGYTNWTVNPARGQRALGNMAWLDELHNLDRYVEIPDEETVEAKLAGEEPPRRGGGGHAQPASKPSRATRTAVDDAEDAEFEDADGEGVEHKGQRVR